MIHILENTKFDFVFLLPYVYQGGAEKATLRIALGLHEIGLKVLVIVRSKNYLNKKVCEWYKQKGLEINFYSKNIVNTLIISCLLFSYRPKWIVSYLSSISNYLISLPSIITGSSFCLSLQNPIEKTTTNKLKIFLLKLVIVRSQFRLAPTSGINNEFLNLGCKNNILLPNPICLELLDKKIKNKKTESQSIYKLISVARLNKQKRFDLIINSVYYLKKNLNLNVSLDIFGEGDEYSDLIYLRNNLGLQNNIEFKGFFEEEELFRNFKNYDLFILSSDFEGFGNVLIEALASGLKVVSTDVPYGPKDILINNDIGKLVKPGDFKKFAEAIHNALTSKWFMLNNELCINHANKYSHLRLAKDFYKKLGSNIDG